MRSIRTAIIRPLIIVALAFGVALPGISSAAAGQRQVLDGFTGEAKAMDRNFQEFSAERGRILFYSSPATGKPDTPSCTSCHTANPANVGQTRAGKEIAPMALSKSPDRYGDMEKVEKWFRRNCNSVLGRACTPVEKGDYLTFMFTQ